jgi:hypothetical protein
MVNEKFVPLLIAHGSPLICPHRAWPLAWALTT